MVVLDLLTEGMILTFCGWLKIISTVILVLEPEFHPNYYSILMMFNPQGELLIVQNQFRDMQSSNTTKYKVTLDIARLYVYIQPKQNSKKESKMHTISLFLLRSIYTELICLILLTTRSLFKHIHTGTHKMYTLCLNSSVPDELRNTSKSKYLKDECILKSIIIGKVVIPVRRIMSQSQSCVALVSLLAGIIKYTTI